MILCYSGISKPSALKIAEASGGEITAVRSSEGGVNYGRNTANTELNPDIGNSVNKRKMRELFKEHGVPMPELIDISTYPRTVNVPCNPIVGRPDRHTKGQGYWLCMDTIDIRTALQGTRSKKAATHFMEFIVAPHEVRVHIFKGKSIRISEKLFRDDRSYTTIKPTCEVKQARKAAKQAVKALGLDFGAVDVLVKEDGTPYVLEVNSAPGIGGTLPALYAETFLAWENGGWDD